MAFGSGLNMKKVDYICTIDVVCLLGYFAHQRGGKERERERGDERRGNKGEIKREGLREKVLGSSL